MAISQPGRQGYDPRQLRPVNLFLSNHFRFLDPEFYDHQLGGAVSRPDRGKYFQQRGKYNGVGFVYSTQAREDRGPVLTLL